MSEVQTEIQPEVVQRLDTVDSSELAENEFSYRPIPVVAPVVLVLGLLSVIGLASVPGLIVPLAGTVLGVFGWRQFRRAGGDLGGGWLTSIGCILSTFFLVLGIGLHSYIYATEVPEGYERLSFRWLSQQGIKFEDGETLIPEEVRKLDGQKVFVKGYMYPENEKKNLRRFVLCKDTGQCCFGGNPELTDMIVVNFVNDTRATFRELSLVNVAGTFRAKKVVVDGQLVALYSLDGEYFK